MDDLVDYIRTGIEVNGRRNVFENRLDEIWPPGDDREKQAAQVSAFAREHGWHVTITQGGRMAIFTTQR